ncbi:MAG: hypothetical protein AMXMBFR7_21990 [Planctomycetota bacterium]
MSVRAFGWFLAVAAAFALPLGHERPTSACCPAPPLGQQVLNADQTLVILWDAANKTEHFIRKASFKTDTPDFGFLIPSPSQPDLNESGAGAFPLLAKWTAPEIQRKPRPNEGMGCGPSKRDQRPGAAKTAEGPEVRVLEEKLVAGFKASVLEADTARVLMEWLESNGFAFSPQVEAWAKPYVEQRWKITALKVVKEKGEPGEMKVEAPALRMSFRTDRPLFPYREPDSQAAAKALGEYGRLLRIFFVAEARYDGELTREQPWTGEAVWSGPLASAQRQELLEQLKLPVQTGPQEAWLTEFADRWPYAPAPADLYFAPSKDQRAFKRPPIIEYYDAPESRIWPFVLGFALALGLVAVWRRGKRAPAN